MNRRLLARLAAVSLVPAVTSCGHDSPTTPATRSATLAVHATTLDSLSNGTVDVVVSYRQQGGQLVAVHATPASIALDGAGMASKQLDVDLAACLADSQRADAEQRGCPLVVELVLRDASGAEIDRQQVTLTSRVSPGQVAEVPAVALANAGSVTIAAPASTSLHPGDKVQLTATVRMPNGSVNDKFPVKWSTSTPAVATVDEKTGEVTAVALGAVTITAKAGVRTSQLALAVVGAVARVAISPDATTIEWTVQDTGKVTLTVTAFDASGAPISDLTGRTIVWASDDTVTATVAAAEQAGQAVATGRLMGKTTITATVDGVRGTAAFTVDAGGTIYGPANTEGIPVLSVGESAALRMYFFDANGAVVPIDETMPGPRSWVSVNPAVATVSDAGVVTGVSIGDTEIRGTFRGMTARQPVFVVSVAKIVVSIRPQTLRVGESVQAEVLLLDPQGRMVIGPVVTFRTSPEGPASVDPNGRVTGQKPGVTQIIASAEGKEGSLEVTVLPAAVASVRMYPTYPAAMTVGEIDTLAATPLNADGLAWPGFDVTWTTNNPAVATINSVTNSPESGISGSKAAIKAVGVGTTTIVATSEGKSASATVTVTPAPPNAPIGMDLGMDSSAPLTYTISIAWNDNSNNEDEFQVERAVGGSNNFALIAKVPGSNNARGFSRDADITEATLYTYRVRACNAGGCSAYNGPGTLPGPLREVTNLVAARDGSGVRLTWQDNSARENGYRVYVLVVGANDVVTYGPTYNLPANTTEFVAPASASGTTVFYHVVPFATLPGFGYWEPGFGPNSQRFTF